MEPYARPFLDGADAISKRDIHFLYQWKECSAMHNTRLGLVVMRCWGTGLGRGVLNPKKKRARSHTGKLRDVTSPFSALAGHERF
jgi:hypothetical protein